MTTFVRVVDTRTGIEQDKPERAVRDHHEVVKGVATSKKPRPPVFPDKPAARRTAQPTSNNSKKE